MSRSQPSSDPMWQRPPSVAVLAIVAVAWVATVQVATPLDTIAQNRAAEVRRLELALVKIDIASDKPQGGFFAHHPIPAFPFIPVPVNAAEIAKAFYEVNRGHVVSLGV